MSQIRIQLNFWPCLSRMQRVLCCRCPYQLFCRRALCWICIGERQQSEKLKLLLCSTDCSYFTHSDTQGSWVFYCLCRGCNFQFHQQRAACVHHSPFFFIYIVSIKSFAGLIPPPHPHLLILCYPILFSSVGSLSLTFNFSPTSLYCLLPPH